MSKATVELDFFAMDKDASSKSRFHKLLHRQRSFRDIQSAISKIKPELLKSVIASGSAGKVSENGSPFKSFSVPSTPKEEHPPFPALPIYSATPSPALESPPETAPLTIFYNGTVAVFDLPREKAEGILKLAEHGINAELADSQVVDQQQRLETDLNGDLPIARRKSLQRFLEKRKERMSLVSPYTSSPGGARI